MAKKLTATIARALATKALEMFLKELEDNTELVRESIENSDDFKSWVKFEKEIQKLQEKKTKLKKRILKKHSPFEIHLYTDSKKATVRIPYYYRNTTNEKIRDMVSAMMLEAHFNEDGKDMNVILKDLVEKLKNGML